MELTSDKRSYAAHQLDMKAHEYIKDIAKTYDAFFNERARQVTAVLSEEERIVILDDTDSTNQMMHDYNLVECPYGSIKPSEKDDLLHYYLKSNAYLECHDELEVVSYIKDNYLLSNLFHYLIRPGFNRGQLDNPVDIIPGLDAEHSNELINDMTEGLCQYYACDYARQNNLKQPNSSVPLQMVIAFFADITDYKVLTNDARNELVFKGDVHSLLAYYKETTKKNYSRLFFERKAELTGVKVKEKKSGFSNVLLLSIIVMVYFPLLCYICYLFMK